MQKPPLNSSTSLILMYTAVFLLCIFFGIILIQVGTPGNYVDMMMFAFIVGGYLFSGMFAKTMILPVFQNTIRTGKPFYIGQAIAAGLISSGVFLFLAGDFYTTGTDALTIFSGLILGIALMTILFAGPVNRAKNSTLASLFGESRLSRLIILIIVVVASLLFLYVQLFAIGIVSETYFGIPEKYAILITAFTISFCTVLGGMQSLSISRMIAYPVLLITFLVPIIWIAYKVTGNPFPQLSFGHGALTAINGIDQELLDARLIDQSEIFDFTKEGLEYDRFNYLAALLCIAFGTASMPHLLQHFRTLPKARNARKSGVWALGFLLLILTAIPAIAAFVKLDIYTSLLGLQLSDLDSDASWLFALNQNGGSILSICGAYVTNTTEAISACGETADYFLTSNDVIPNPDILVISSAVLNELPSLTTTLLATGALLAIWSTADGLIFVSANALSEDGYCSLIRPKSPMGTRLFMSRVFLLAITIASTYMALNIQIDIQFVFAASFALLCSSLFPALLCQFWLKYISQNIIMIGISLGFVMTSAMLWLSHFGLDLNPLNGDEFVFYLPLLTNELKPLATGFVGMMFSFIIIFTTQTFVKNKPSKNLSVEAKSDVPA